MRSLLILSVLIISVHKQGFSQSLPVIKPELSFELDFSQSSISKFLSDEAFKDCRDLLDKLESEGRSGTNEYNHTEQQIFFYCDETKDQIWDIEGGGCSWYCAGGPSEISASSSLSSQGDNSYQAKNAHDLNYQTAWVEGVQGYGNGEYLLYNFKGDSPRINTIKILNGYIKSRLAWKNNSRVKTLKMYVNAEPYALLELEDYYGEQVFKVEPIGNSERTNKELLSQKPDWTLKFEVVDIYPGLKYQDVAITEIYFSGLDVH